MLLKSEVAALLEELSPGSSPLSSAKCRRRDKDAEDAGEGAAGEEVGLGSTAGLAGEAGAVPGPPAPLGSTAVGAPVEEPTGTHPEGVADVDAAMAIGGGTPQRPPCHMPHGGGTPS